MDRAGRKSFYFSPGAIGTSFLVPLIKAQIHLMTLLEQGEYGRHLCAGLAEASALKDSHLVHKPIAEELLQSSQAPPQDKK